MYFTANRFDACDDSSNEEVWELSTHAEDAALQFMVLIFKYLHGDKLGCWCCTSARVCLGIRRAVTDLLRLG